MHAALGMHDSLCEVSGCCSCNSLRCTWGCMQLYSSRPCTEHTQASAPRLLLLAAAAAAAPLKTPCQASPAVQVSTISDEVLPLAATA